MSNRSLVTILVALLLPILSSPLHCSSGPTINDFGSLPAVRSMSLSPDGETIALIRENHGRVELVLFTLDKHSPKSTVLPLPDEIKGRSTYFVTNNDVILTASETTKFRRFRSKVEMGGSYVYSIKDHKVHLLLNKTRDVHPYQTGLGQILGVSPDEDAVFMPAYSKRRKPTNDLYRVSLKDGLGELHSRGTPSTRSWFVGDAGNVLARVDFNDTVNEQSVYSYLDGEPRQIFFEESESPRLAFGGVSDDEKLLFFTYIGTRDDGVFSLDLFTGEVEGPHFFRPSAEAEVILTHKNRKAIGVKFSQKPYHQFMNSDVNKSYEAISKSFPASSISIASMSRDQSKFILQISGNYDPHAFVLFDSVTSKLNSLGNGYPNIKKEHLGEVVSFNYKARDGLEIPAILTWPNNASTSAQRMNLPLLVMPHGGPESYDRIDFNWKAQFFAHQGYLVLQPNFRGSTGYGHEFRNAGRGKWGREMQDDVTDGVLHLIEKGIADKDRVCIIGASYGGYSALIGGARSPDLYRCVVSIAGVSDLGKMLREQKDRLGRRHWINRYWKTVIGDPHKELDHLEAISPINHAAQFQAPVLLIHGKDDTVVPLNQSEVMHKALRKAGKDVRLVELEGEDHWLSKSSTRLRVLEEVEQFVRTNNPAGQNSASNEH